MSKSNTFKKLHFPDKTYCQTCLCVRFYLSRVIRKPDFAYMQKRARIICAVTAELINALVFATQIVQSIPQLQFRFGSLLLVFGVVSPYLCSYYFSSVWVAEWPAFGK